MFPKLGKLSLPVLAGALLLGGCESVTGTNQGDETRIVLTRSGSASASLAPAFYAAVASALPPVALDNISSIDITLTHVEALPQGGDEDAEEPGTGGWVTLELTAPATINFLALPTDAATGGLELARGDLPAGTYGNLRLISSAATITFKAPVRVGQVTYPADKAIPLTIPSKKIKVPTASFTVTAESGTTIKVVFDAAASVRKIIATGADKIIMPPVLTASESED